jgi:hypothetical protein
MAAEADGLAIACEIGRGSGKCAPIKLTTEQFEALAIVAPATTADDIWRRLLEHGLSRGGRPRKTGRAAQPVSGPEGADDANDDIDN